MDSSATIWCPVCDEGWVRAVHIAPIDINGQLCSECEAFWPSDALVQAGEFKQLSALAKQNSLELGQIVVTTPKNS